MKTSIEQVSQDIKNKISKHGTGSLVKKYKEGVFEGDELIAAIWFLTRRNALPKTPPIVKQQNQSTTQTTTFGRHSSQMTEQEIEQADRKRESRIKKNILSQDNISNLGTLLTQSENKLKVTINTQTKIVKSKPIGEPVIKLTQQESILFEVIKQHYDATNNSQIFHNTFKSLREYKGVLGSLKKKNIVSYNNDLHTLKVEKIGQQMINGTLLYKQKNKHEQNFFRNTRTTVEIDGKPLEKSAYVRLLLRKKNDMTCSELNEQLEQIGFTKLYHSELQRCKQQLGIVNNKNKH